MPSREDSAIEPGASTWKNGEGEFEVVLGNKQLLSVFFIIVILLAAFFMMGYMVGRSTGGDLARRNNDTPAARNDTTTAMPRVVSPSQQPAQQQPAAESPQVTKTETPLTDSQPNTTSTETATQVPVTPAPAAQSPHADASKPLEVSPVTTTVVEPAAGASYVQVRATAKPEAEVIAEVLVKKGYHVIIAPGPNDKVVRVLVGPTKDAAETGKIIGDMDQLGFKGAFPKHY